MYDNAVPVLPRNREDTVVIGQFVHNNPPKPREGLTIVDLKRRSIMYLMRQLRRISLLNKLGL
jgi:hypothetical protein